MAYTSSAYFRANTRLQPPKAQVAGGNALIFHTHVFDKVALNTTDILELFPIPPGARIASISYASENLPAGNMNLGWMSGTPGTPDGARTVGTQFVNGVAHAATDINVALSLLRLQDRSDTPRSIGMTASVNIGVAANRNITFRIELQF